jgi:hypothetical protein
VPRSSAPCYRFIFPGGLLQRGDVLRVSPAIDGGRTHRFRYLLDDRLLAIPLGRSMPPEAADLLDVCAAIYFADRQAPREIEGDVRPPGERGPRRMELAIPIRRRDRWQSPEIHTLLEELAFFLSDDDWTVRFVERTADPRFAEGQAHLFAPKLLPDPRVTLFSGGLDSLLGLVDAVASGAAESVLAISVVTHPRLRRVVDGVLAEVRGGSATAIQGLRLRVSMLGPGRELDDREGSQRARALLYLAAGIVVAAMAGRGLLQVTENGPGAINLPGTPDQTGARTTRAMHPKTLALFARLASAVLDRPMSVVNTGLWRTKGELAASLGDGPLASPVQRTVSCDRFPYLPANRACGTCGSCLYRRIALNAAGLAHLDRKLYDTDVLDPTLPWSGRDLLPLLGLRESVARLRTALGERRPYAALDAGFATIDDVVAAAPSLGLTEDETQAALVRLFNAHVRDAEAFFARIDRPGWGRFVTITQLGLPTLTAAG